jgi:Putative MetA-pathway of phenol degradation
VNTITTGHELTKNIGAYVELTSATGDGTHAATFDVGVTFKLNAHTQLDCGANIGLSRAADDLTVFAGFSRRF